MSIANTKIYWMSALILAAVSGIAQAGISLDRTRIILTGKDTSASANLTNTSPDVPFLAQSWVEDSKGNKITSPLMVLPPLQRINGGQKGVARITKTDGINQLPQDRESLFYLSVREIPPRSEKPNVLQLAMQSRIKLFFRPTAIIPESKSAIWQDQIIFQKNGNRMRVENPTPYYVTIISLNRAKGEKITQFPGIMLEPKSSQDFTVTTPGISEFSMTYVNDYGGHPQLKYRCAVNICKALPLAQQD